MSDSLHELYQEIILDHNRHPRNFNKITPSVTKLMAIILYVVIKSPFIYILTPKRLLTISLLREKVAPFQWPLPLL